MVQTNESEMDNAPCDAFLGLYFLQDIYGS